MLNLINNETLHQENCHIIKIATGKDLERLIHKQQKLSNCYRYDDVHFNAVCNFIKYKFYKSTMGASNKTSHYMRRREEGLEDITTNDLAIRQTILFKFNYNIDPILQEYAIWLIPAVHSAEYLPYSDEKIVVLDSAPYSNSYVPPMYKVQSNSVEIPQLWKEYLDRIAPPNQSYWRGDKTILKPIQSYLNQWLAHRIQKPYEAPHTALLLRGEQGSGKSLMFDKLFRELVGFTNYETIKLGDIKGSHTGGLYENTLVQIAEFSTNRKENEALLKEFISQDEAYVRKLYSNPKTVKRYFGVALTTNEPNPISFDTIERRYFIPNWIKHKVNPVESDSFFSRFLNWLEKGDGYQQMFDYFSNCEITEDFNSFAPMTEDKENNSMDESRAGSKLDLITIKLGEAEFERYAFKLVTIQEEFTVTQSVAIEALKKSGFNKINRRWVNGHNSMVLWVHNKWKTHQHLTVFTGKGFNLYHTTSIVNSAYNQ